MVERYAAALHKSAVQTMAVLLYGEGHDAQALPASHESQLQLQQISKYQPDRRDLYSARR